MSLSLLLGNEVLHGERRTGDILLADAAVGTAIGILYHRTVRLRRRDAMPFTERQTQLAMAIDTHVKRVLARGGGDEALLMSLADHMGTFKQFLDTCTRAEMDALCARY